MSQSHHFICKSLVNRHYNAAEQTILSHLTRSLYNSATHHQHDSIINNLNATANSISSNPLFSVTASATTPMSHPTKATLAPVEMAQYLFSPLQISHAGNIQALRANHLSHTRNDLSNLVNRYNQIRGTSHSSATELFEFFCALRSVFKQRNIELNTIMRVPSANEREEVLPYDDKEKEVFSEFMQLALFCFNESLSLWTQRNQLDDNLFNQIIELMSVLLTTDSPCDIVLPQEFFDRNYPLLTVETFMQWFRFWRRYADLDRTTAAYFLFCRNPAVPFWIYHQTMFALAENGRLTELQQLIEDFRTGSTSFQPPANLLRLQTALSIRQIQHNSAQNSEPRAVDAQARIALVIAAAAKKESSQVQLFYKDLKALMSQHGDQFFTVFWRYNEIIDSKRANLDGKADLRMMYVAMLSMHVQLGSKAEEIDQLLQRAEHYKVGEKSFFWSDGKLPKDVIIALFNSHVQTSNNFYNIRPIKESLSKLSINLHSRVNAEIISILCNHLINLYKNFPLDYPDRDNYIRGYCACIEELTQFLKFQLFHEMSRADYQFVPQSLRQAVDATLQADSYKYITNLQAISYILNNDLMRPIDYSKFKYVSVPAYVSSKVESAIFDVCRYVITIPYYLQQEPYRKANRIAKPPSDYIVVPKRNEVNDRVTELLTFLLTLRFRPSEDSLANLLTQITFNSSLFKEIIIWIKLFNIQPTSSTFNVFLHHAIKTRDSRLIIQTIELMKLNKITIPLGFYHASVAAVTALEDVDALLTIVNQAVADGFTVDTRITNALLYCFAQNKKIEEVKTIYAQLESKLETIPNMTTFHHLLLAALTAADVEFAQKVWLDINQKFHFKPDSTLAAVLVSLWNKLKSPYYCAEWVVGELGLATVVNYQADSILARKLLSCLAYSSNKDISSKATAASNNLDQTKQPDWDVIKELAAALLAGRSEANCSASDVNKESAAPTTTKSEVRGEPENIPMLSNFDQSSDTSQETPIDEVSADHSSAPPPLKLDPAASTQIFNEFIIKFNETSEEYDSIKSMTDYKRVRQIAVLQLHEFAEQSKAIQLNEDQSKQLVILLNSYLERSESHIGSYIAAELLAQKLQLSGVPTLISLAEEAPELLEFMEFDAFFVRPLIYYINLFVDKDCDNRLHLRNNIQTLLKELYVRELDDYSAPTTQARNELKGALLNLKEFLPAQSKTGLIERLVKKCEAAPLVKKTSHKPDVNLIKALIRDYRITKALNAPQTLTRAVAMSNYMTTLSRLRAQYRLLMTDRYSAANKVRYQMESTMVLLWLAMKERHLDQEIGKAVVQIGNDIESLLGAQRYLSAYSWAKSKITQHKKEQLNKAKKKFLAK
jgi:hypothetical protein